MILLTRRFTFSASHRLVSPDLDAAGNARTYGACQRLHGHNFRLEVTVAGTPGAETGFFCNVLDLERLVRQTVIEPCDHQCLNDLPMFAGAVPTMEVVAQVLWTTLQPGLERHGLRLAELLFAETDEQWVRIREPADGC